MRAPLAKRSTTLGTVTVEYDEIGQGNVTTVTDDRILGTMTCFAYDDAGRRTSLTYPNGVVTSYGYDNANRLSSIDHIKTPATVEALTYVSDAAGNRTKVTRANAAATLIPQTVTNTAFDAANEQTQFNSASTNLVYDNNGNLTSFTDASGTTTYTWNARNQLTAISGPSLSASFVYDGLGRRSTKTINSTTTGFWYDGADVLAELSGGTPTAAYIRSLSIDEPFIRKQAGGDEFYQTDALGSTLALTDGSGMSNTEYAYEPFGKTTKTGASTSGLQYTGREEDGTGLSYYRARYFSPRLQRFITEDPIEYEAGDLNLYAYNYNSPTNHRDPSGQFVGCLVTSVIAGAAIDAGAQLYGNYALGQRKSVISAAIHGAAKGALLGGLCGLSPLANAIRGAKSAGTTLTEAGNAANSVRLSNQLAAEEIAGGHAFGKHVIQKTEFPGITTTQEFAQHIEGILNNPSAVRFLSNGRTAFWDETSGTIVIRNAARVDGGTAFRPTGGRSYFNGLK